VEREDGRHVVIDVGTGDGRWLYRLARARPEWLYIGIDATLDAARPTMRRARRRRKRGGAPNLVFVRARAETLPGPFAGVAVSPTLVPRADGRGRVAAVEVMVATDAIRKSTPRGDADPEPVALL